MYVCYPNSYTQILNFFNEGIPLFVFINNKGDIYRNNVNLGDVNRGNTVRKRMDAKFQFTRCEKGLNLAKELEFHFIKIDRSMVLVDLKIKLQSKNKVKMNHVSSTFFPLKEDELGGSYLTVSINIEKFLNFRKVFLI